MANSNYYEYLGLHSNASAAEIDAALTAKYNEVRRLVIHHDPNVVNRANYELEVIAQARNILLTPQKRTEYDRSIQVITVGGVADPQAILQKFNTPTSGVMMSPLSVKPAGGSNQQAERVDAWSCRKCQTANSIGTRFCKKCGNEIGINCPNCANLIEAGTVFCQSCGVNVQETLQKIEQDRLRKEEGLRLQQMAEAAEKRRKEEQLAILGPVVKKATQAQNFMIAGLLLCFFIGLCTYGLSSIIGVPLLIYAMVLSRQVLGYSQVPGDTAYRSQAKLAFWVSLAVVVFVAIIIAVVALAALFALLQGGM